MSMQPTETEPIDRTWDEAEDRARFADLLQLISCSESPREHFTTRAPFSGAPLVELPICSKEDVFRATDSARAAQRRWSVLPLRERSHILDQFADRLWARREDLLSLMQLETGKTRRDAFEEVADVLLNILHYRRVAPKLLSTQRRRGAMPLIATARIKRHPVGVVGVIAPWNYPLTLAISDAIPALLAGNAIVLKPAEQTSLTALFIRHFLIESGLPRDLFQVVTGRGEDLGPPLIDRIDFLQFTGSTRVGRIVGRQAGDRLIGSSLELGGKNPMIIFDDAPIETTIDGIVKGCFTNAGQLCISFERIYVQREIHVCLIPKLIARIRSMKISNEAGYDVDMGSMISEEQLVKVEEHVEDAVYHGAEVLAGGKRLPDLGPLFYAPTLLTGVTEKAMVHATETFGPVASIYVFDDGDEAVRLANDSEYGLNASIWSGDVQRAIAIAQRIQCGSVAINDAYGSTWGAHGAPIGGWKSSGTGRRHGDEGLLKYTESQTITTQRFHPVAVSSHVSGNTFVRAVEAFIRLKRRLPFL